MEIICKNKRDGENVSLYVKINDEWKYVLKYDKIIV